MNGSAGYLEFRVVPRAPGWLAVRGRPSCWSSLLLGWLWQPLFWLGLLATAWCVYFFRDPVARDAGRSGAGRQPGRRRGGDHGRAHSAARARSWASAAALRRHLHERVRRAREPHAGGGHGGRAEPIMPASSSTPRSTSPPTRTSGSRSRSAPPAAARSASSRSRAWSPAASSPSSRRARRSPPGQRVGLIRFGSRCDVYLPEGVEPLVLVGQRTLAGETVLADLFGNQPKRQGRAS